MEDLVNLLNELVVKYDMSEDDIAAIQEALGNLESGAVEEFTYEEPAEDAE